VVRTLHGGVSHTWKVQIYSSYFDATFQGPYGGRFKPSQFSLFSSTDQYRLEVLTLFIHLYQDQPLKASLQLLVSSTNAADFVSRVQPRQGFEVSALDLAQAPFGLDNKGKRKRATVEPIAKMLWEHRPYSDITRASGRFGKEGRKWFEKKGEPLAADAEAVSKKRWTKGVDYSTYARCYVLGRTEDKRVSTNWPCLI